MPYAPFFSFSVKVVKQLNGEYQARNEGLQPLDLRAKELIAKIGRGEVQYIPRG